MNDETRRSGGSEVIQTAILFEAALGVLALAIGWWWRDSPWWRIHWNLQDALWGVAATAPLTVIMLGLGYAPWRPLVRLRKFVRYAVRELFGQATLAQIALVSLMAGLGEELLFRGVIQAWLAESQGAALGIAVASLLFGLAHPISTAYVVVAAIIGVYLGWLLIAFDNLLVPIVVHGLYDFLAILYLRK